MDSDDTYASTDLDYENEVEDGLGTPSNQVQNNMPKVTLSIPPMSMTDKHNNDGSGDAPQ